MTQKKQKPYGLVPRQPPVSKKNDSTMSSGIISFINTESNRKNKSNATSSPGPTAGVILPF